MGGEASGLGFSDARILELKQGEQGACMSG